MKRALGISALLMLTVLFVACRNNHTPKEGLRLPFEIMRHGEEIEFPPGDILETEILDNQIIIHDKSGNKFIVNRDQIWFITTKQLPSNIFFWAFNICIISSFLNF